MSKVAIKGADTGTGVFTLESPATNTDRTLVLPDEAGTVLTSASSLAGLSGVGKVVQMTYGTTSSLGTSTDNSTWVSANLSASITPTSASSKILIMGQHGSARVSGGSSNGITLRLNRGETFILYPVYEFLYSYVGLDAAIPFHWVDSPASTSSLTYNTAFRLLTSASSTAQINPNSVSAIMILMEIAS